MDSNCSSFLRARERSGTPILRKVGLALLLSGALALLVFLAGPQVDTSFHPRPIALPGDLEAYLRTEEARFPQITPGAEKAIVWARPDHARTPLAIVYLHGFSATRQETAPLCDEVAARLGANLFYTRFTGHGQAGAALAQASVSDWLNDATEALEMGRRLGDRVLVVGCSTGGAVAAWLATQGDGRDVLGYVLISANFAPKDPKAKLLTWPWARQLIPRLVGEQLDWPVSNERHGKYWTTSYPTTALIPLMGLCAVARSLDLTSVRTPLLMVYCPQDHRIQISEIERAFHHWGSPKKQLLPVELPPRNDTHVIAGDIRAPDGTQPIADAIVHFVGEIRAAN